jgi:hypothetical protein
MLSYTLCAVSYLQARFRSTNRDSSLTKEIDFAIDSLSGDTRVRVLYFMIVESGYKPANNKAAFTALYNRIRLLHFATDYARGIEEQYQKVMREQQLLGTTKDRLPTNEFFLADGLKNPLAASLFITHLPTWIALNRSERIDDIDISFEDRFRYNLAGH